MQGDISLPPMMNSELRRPIVQDLWQPDIQENYSLSYRFLSNSMISV